MHTRLAAMAVVVLSTFGGLAANLRAADAPAYQRTEDVIYGRKPGLALTLDVIAPTGKANGAAIMYMMSGGWLSAHEMINPEMFTPFTRRGYTVFAVVHGSQPKYAIPEILEDIHRSIRFVRHHAREYGVDPDRIGIAGGSAGGHLSLMMGTTGGPGKPDAQDPVDRESSKVQAVACFFPPTDFLNYGRPGRDVYTALDEELAPFRAPFDFTEVDAKQRRYVLIADTARRLQIAREISPVYQVTPDDAPTLMIHGDADKLVPIQQSERMQEALRKAGVPCKLVVKHGEDHGWKDWLADLSVLADWFDIYLAPGATGSHAASAAASQPG